MELFAGFVVGYSSFLNCIKSSQIYSFTKCCNLRPIFIPLSIQKNSFKPKFIATTSSVLRALEFVAVAQIRSSVVQFISIPMVNKKSFFFTDYKWTYSDIFSIYKSGDISLWIQIPLVKTNSPKIFFTYFKENIFICNLNFHFRAYTPHIRGGQL